MSAETADAGTSASASPPSVSAVSSSIETQVADAILQVALGTLFALNSSKDAASPLVLYGGEWSDSPFVNPSSVGITTLLPSPASTTPLPSGISALAEGASAWDPLTQRGWVHGGHIDVHTQPGWSNQVARIFLWGMLEFDYSGGAGNPQVTNGTSDRGPMADHTITFVPASASNTSEGLLVILGGMMGSTQEQMILAPTQYIYTYDIGAKHWSTEFAKTVDGGPMPDQRVNHCAALAVGEVNGVQSWQIYMHGGQNMDQSEQYSDTWALSGPDFTYVVAFRGSIPALTYSVCLQMGASDRQLHCKRPFRSSWAHMQP